MSKTDIEKKKNKTVSRALIFMSLLLTSSIISLKSNELLFFKNNIYDSRDDLKVSEEEIDEMISELSNEIDKDITKDDLLLYSVLSNNNITEEDKDRIYNLTTLIEDNKYIDKDKAYRDLSLLRINYIERKKGISKNIRARYMFPENVIEIYDEKFNRSVFYHEIIHCIFNNENSRKLPRFFSEGVTEVLSNEYFGVVPYLEINSYIYENVMVKILCELVGSDKVMDAYSTGDFNIISEELEKNSTSSRRDINNMFFKLDRTLEDNDIDPDDFKKLYDLLEEVYVNKLVDGSVDSINTQYLLELFKGFNTKTKYSYYFDKIEELGASTKIYFNNNIKEKDYTYEQHEIEIHDNHKVYNR